LGTKSSFSFLFFSKLQRLFFRPEHVGMTKTDASKKTLEEINPDVIYETHTYNVTKLQHYDHFLDRYGE
jgi:ubiquitin-like modifier-activating enzyme 5